MLTGQAEESAKKVSDAKDAISGIKQATQVDGSAWAECLGDKMRNNSCCYAGHSVWMPMVCFTYPSATCSMDQYGSVWCFLMFLAGAGALCLLREGQGGEGSARGSNGCAVWLRIDVKVASLAQTEDAPDAGFDNGEAKLENQTHYQTDIFRSVLDVRKNTAQLKNLWARHTRALRSWALNTCE